MGSKNRVFLGILNSVILHYFRNVITQKEFYITKFKVKKIKAKHPEISHFILEHNFQLVIDNTIASCDYKHKGIHNLLSVVNGRYILYSVSINNFYLEGGTLFYTSKRQLKKCESSMKFFTKNAQKDFEKYLEEN